MIEISIFRERPEIIKKSQINRGKDPSIVDEVVKADESWRKMQTEVQVLQNKRNTVTREISELKKHGKDIDKKVLQMKKISDKIKKSEEKISERKEEMYNLMKKIPNLLDENVPIGKSEAENKELRKWGKIPKFNFAPKSHTDLVEELEIVDSRRGAKVAGARCYYLRKEMVMLNLALQQFALEFLMKKGFTPIQTPYFLNKFSMGGAVDFTAFEDSIYKIEGEDLYLIGTSEHALAAFHSEEIIDVKKPIKYAGLSSCFRKEAGSHGKDTKGIFRVHRFEKVEQFGLCKAEDEKIVFDEFIKNQEEIFRLLEIPYRIVALCSGDVGGSMSRTLDLEGWFPSQNCYRELGSTSTAKSYQSHKLNIKYVKGENNKEYVYTLNGTAMTVQRTMCCLIENCQQKDGSIKIPKVLLKHMCGIEEIKPVDR